MSEASSSGPARTRDDELDDLVPFPIARETKPGYKTTELYVALAGILAIVLDIIPAPDRKEGLYSSVIVAAYAIARGLAKLAVPETVQSGKMTRGDTATGGLLGRKVG